MEFFWTVRCENKRKKYSKPRSFRRHIDTNREIDCKCYYLEKSFASLTGANAIVLTGGIVPAHSAAALVSTRTL